jgi:hypothetical protein
MHIVWLAQKSPNGPGEAIFLRLTTAHGTDTASATFPWRLRCGQDGDKKLFVEGDTTAPFRAQQGQLHVYPQSMKAWPSNPDGQAQAWRWDNASHPWNTGLDWGQGWHIAWVAQQPPNGPYTLFVKLTT